MNWILGIIAMLQGVGLVALYLIARDLTVQLADIRGAIAPPPAPVDFAPIVGELQQLQRSIDTLPPVPDVATAVKAAHTPVDLTPVLGELQRIHTAMQEVSPEPPPVVWPMEITQALSRVEHALRERVEQVKPVPVAAPPKPPAPPRLKIRIVRPGRELLRQRLQARRNALG